MKATLRYVRLGLSYILLAFFAFAAVRYDLSVYLIKQISGQIGILSNTQSIESYVHERVLSEKELKNLQLIEEIKKYSVDTLGYNKSESYRRIYDQGGKPVLWVITASEPYELKPVKWNFPIVGNVTYKGFFEKPLAETEFNHLRAEGYDVEIRSVSAWSTLGWLKDPILSSMLLKSKGSICNLLFHELFHATYYAPSSVNFNENIASFIAHQATIRFLSQNDTPALEEYLTAYHANRVFETYVLRKNKELKKYYSDIKNMPDRHLLKLRKLNEMADSIEYLPASDLKKLRWRADMLKFKNAFFISFEQYDSMQDSLENVFNKFYDRDVKKMVRDLKLKASNY